MVIITELITGADEDQAESMVKVLHISSDNRRIPTEQKVKPKPHHKY